MKEKYDRCDYLANVIEESHCNLKILENARDNQFVGQDE